MKFTFHNGDKPLPDYTVRRGIGHGGFGEVYYAVSDAGKEVALKYIQQHADIELRGVRQCMNLKCPNLVTIFDVRENADGQTFVLMEYVAGPGMGQMLIDAGGALELEAVGPLFKQLATAIDYLHAHGIVHRDLKPSNIFIEDGVAKIGDYGLSKFIAASEYSGHTAHIGSIHYMAPEIGSGDYGKGVDIYALGAVLYQMLTGRVPFDGETAAEILMKHLTAQPDLEPVPEPLRPIVAKALAKDPKARFDSAGEMAAALQAALDGKPAPERPKPTPAPSDTEFRRSQQPTMQPGRAGPGHGRGRGPTTRAPAYGMSLGHRIALAVVALVVVQWCALRVFPGMARVVRPDVIVQALLGAAAVTLATSVLRGFGVVEPLSFRLYALAVGLAFVYGFQQIWGGWSPMQRTWLFYFLIVLGLTDWRKRTRPGRPRAVMLGWCARSALLGCVAGAVSRVGLGAGALTAALMCFMVQLLSYGPIFGLGPGAFTLPAWLLRCLWSLGALGAASAACAGIHWSSDLTAGRGAIMLPMGLGLCAAAFWFCVGKVISPRGDNWTGRARLSILAGAAAAGGMAILAAGHADTSLRTLAFTTVIFCGCAALYVKLIPCAATQGRLAGRHVVVWLAGLFAFGLFCVLPSVGLSAWHWHSEQAAALWLIGGALGGLLLLGYCRRLTAMALLAALTLAGLLVVTFAFGHYAFYLRAAQSPWLMAESSCASAASVSPQNFAPLSWASMTALAAPAAFALLLLLWPSADGRSGSGGES